MPKGTFEYDDRTGAQRSPERELVRERDQLKEELRLARETLDGERKGQFSTYRQLVELERARAFDGVARGIEHELYNALIPVEGFTELLLTDPKSLANPELAQSYLQAILTASKEAKSVITRMREFYYSTRSIDLKAHGSVSQVLAKALSSQQLAPSASGADGDIPEVPTESLSPREWDVLRLLSDGLKNREIAEMLTVSENTVKTHIKAILSKLNLKNRTQAAAYALLDQQAFA